VISLCCEHVLLFDLLLSVIR